MLLKNTVLNTASVAQVSGIEDESGGLHTMKFVRTALGFTLALLALAATAEIQRWTDEHGVVHYGDKIPPEYAGRGSVQLNSQGVRVKEKSRELTDVERQQESQLQVQQREMARQREEQLRRDRSLIDTYANLDEIKRVRDRALESIDNAINVTQIRLTEIAKPLCHRA